MGPDDLQKFIKLLEESGELKRISVAVDPDLEAAAIIDRVCKQRGGGHALLFEAITGAALPLAANLFGSQKRVALALGVEDVEQLAARLRQDLAATGKSTSATALKQLTCDLDWQASVAEGPLCFSEGLMLRGLNALPALRSWPQDGGRYLTLGQVFTRHPETARGNCGMYRLQVVDNTTALLRCHPGSGGGEHIAAWHARGEEAPIAIVLGGPPVLTLVAGITLPRDVEEVAFAGYLTGRSLSMIRCRNSDLQVPANAEVVIEGLVAPGEFQIEGPFGNHTGYYAPAALVPVLRVERVQTSDNAVCPGTVVGPPPMENVHLATAAARIMLPLLQFDCPWVVDVHLPVEGIYHRAAIVAVSSCSLTLASIGKALRSSILLRNSRQIILVGEEIAPCDLSQVYWRVVNVGTWAESLIVEGGLLLIDARKSKWSAQVKADEATSEKINRLWQNYGLE